jgi:hypothetical protein
MSQRKTLSKVPLTPQFTTNFLSYADVVKQQQQQLLFCQSRRPKEAEQLQ